MTNTEEKLKKEMKDKLRNIRGITLISLVITVIILLILAAVAINLAVDSNGLFAKTGEAGNGWNRSVAEEDRALENIMLKANEINVGTAEGGGSEDNPLALPDGWNEEAVASTVTEGGRTAPIPTGFVASSVDGENTISDGLVIYETDAAVTDENHDTALTTYNQYVWIPVDNVNDMIMCQTHGASVTLDTTTLQCPTCGADTKLAGKLYTTTGWMIVDGDGNTIWKMKMDFTQSDQTYDANSGKREPAIVTGLDGTSYDGSSSNYHGLESATAFLTQLQNDFDRMAQSVAKYKGFYISRYEVGAGGASKKGQTVLNAGSDSANMWYGLYNILRSNPDTTASTYSQMIWRKPV